MCIRIRLDDPHAPEADRALVDAMWRRSLDERAGEGGRYHGPLPRARDYPTARFLLATDGAQTCVGVAGSVLPGPQARYGFESRVALEHPSLPIHDRTRVGEGLMLYVVPEHRRQGLAYALTFLSMLLPWHAGASHIVAENGAVSLDMARAAGFTDTGVVTMHRRDVPYHLTVGATEEVLRKAWASSERGLARFEVTRPLREMIERFEDDAR
ncbi:N-acetyltransferase [Paraliomyxa miuraensis]|uniref:hypothetical protein n=1 Tax=Paraliomyxa miuraensis TaxID=376150 RepID=UPI002251C653|nr:hypothetical protein [Paraliomyxa miuraensis]